MDFLHNLLWHHDKFLGITWNAWKVVGLVGNAIFFSRFIVQWYATEKRKQVVVPQGFWWLSLIGTVVMLTYAVCYLKDSVPSPQSPDLVTGWRLAMIERAEWDAISDVDARRERGQQLAVRELTDGLLWPMYEEALATSDLV